MKTVAGSPHEYVSKLPEERQVPFGKLREVILKNIPQGFTETITYGMIGYAVPHSVYSRGYHVDPKLLHPV